MTGRSRLVTTLLLASMVSIVLLWAVTPRAAAAALTAGQMLDGTVVSVSGTTLVAQMSDGVQHTYRLASTVPITRNGQKSDLGALRAGDELTVTTDAAGTVTAVDAAGAFAPAAPQAPAASATPTQAPTGPASSGHLLDGTVVSVTGGTLVAQMSDGVQHTYSVGASAPVTRNGQRGSVGALRAGDQVTVTSDAHGAVTAVDAAGAFAPAAPSTPIVPPATPTLAPPAQQPGPRTLDGTLVIASNMGLTAQLSDGTQRDFRPAPGLRVSRNGQGSSLEALQPGDQITIATDADGDAITVDAAGAYASGTQTDAPSNTQSQASGTQSQASPGAQAQPSSGAGAIQGTLVATWGGGIAARLPDGVHDFGLAASPRVTRNGRTSGVAKLQSGDAITLTADTDGAVASVEAAGAPSATTTTTAGDAAAIVAPPLVVLLLALGGLLYRRARRTGSAA